MDWHLPLRASHALINLDALAANLCYLQAQLGQVQLLIALKANAYGHGVLEIAKVCQEAGVYGFAVATLKECWQLRSAGFNEPILLLNELFADEIDYALRCEASFSVSTQEYAQLLNTKAQALGVFASVQIEFDSGMGRLGVLPKEAENLAICIVQCHYLKLEGVWSHFASAEQEDQSFSQQQYRLFKEFLGQLKRVGFDYRYAHMANSAGMLYLKQCLTNDNLARPGIAVYGLSPGAKPVAHLQPLLSLRSRILKISHYSQGWGIGYGSTWKASHASLIALVPLGYADGYLRTLSNRAQVLVHGQRVNVVGRVSMDLFTIDLSPLAHQEPAVKVGDEVVIIGQQQFQGRQFYKDMISAEEVAAWADTICYEITCSLSARVERVFRKGGIEFRV